MNYLGLTVFAGNVPGIILDFNKESKEYTIEFTDGRVVTTPVVDWELNIPADPEVAKYRYANRQNGETLVFGDTGWDVISGNDLREYWETGAPHEISEGADADDEHMRSDIGGNSVERHTQKELYNNRKDEEGNPEQNFPDGEEEEIISRRQASPELRNNHDGEDDVDEDVVLMPPVPHDVEHFLERADTAEPDPMKTDREFPSGEYKERQRIPNHSHVREQNAWEDQHYANNDVCEDCGDPLVNGHCYHCLDKKKGISPEEYGKVEQDVVIREAKTSAFLAPLAPLAAPVIEALGLGAAEAGGAAAAGGLGAAAAEGAGAGAVGSGGLGGAMNFVRSPQFTLGQLAGRALGGGNDDSSDAATVAEPNPIPIWPSTAATQPDTEIYAVPNRGDNSNPDIGGTGGYNMTHGDGPEYMKDVNDIGGTISVIRRFTDMGDMDKAIEEALDVIADGIPSLIEFAEKEESGKDVPEIKEIDKIFEAMFGEEYSKARDEEKSKKKESKVAQQNAICRLCNKPIIVGQQVCSSNPPLPDCPTVRIQAMNTQQYAQPSTPPKGPVSPVTNAPGGAAYGMSPILTKTIKVLAARRPKMCPYHAELVDYSLALSDPASALGALSQHLYSDHSCKGGWGEREGVKCKFKPEMVREEYWEEKERAAEERKQQREQEKALQAQQEQQMMEEQPMEEVQEILTADIEVQEIPEATPDDFTNTGDSPISYNDYSPPENYYGDSATDNGTYESAPEEFAMTSSRDWLVNKTAADEDDIRVYEYPGEDDYDMGSANGEGIEDVDGNPVQEGEIYRVGPDGQIPDVVKVVSVDPQYIEVERIDSAFPEDEGRPYRLSLKEIMVQDILIEKDTGSDEQHYDPLEGTPETNDDAGVGQQDTHGVTDLSTGHYASNKEVDNFIKELEGRGYQIARGGSNHYKVFKQGRLIATIPSTPSDPRSLMNARKQIDRAERVMQAQAEGEDIEIGSRRASEKVAGYDYSIGEQRQFINEGGTARNLDKLDLEGTHYPEELGYEDDDYFLWG